MAADNILPVLEMQRRVLSYLASSQHISEHMPAVLDERERRNC